METSSLLRGVCGLGFSEPAEQCYPLDAQKAETFASRG